MYAQHCDSSSSRTSLSSAASMIHNVRTLVMALSIAVLALSLCSYNAHSAPIATHISTGDTLDIVAAMIQDRQLIATLVASQASILCPRFLVLASRSDPVDEPLSWRKRPELMAEAIIPFLLAIGWIFSIIFDLKLTIMLNGLGRSVCSNTTLGYLAYGVKHLLVLSLIAEFMLVCMDHFLNEKYGSIRLSMTGSAEEGEVKN